MGPLRFRYNIKKRKWILIVNGKVFEAEKVVDLLKFVEKGSDGEGNTA